MMHRNGKLKDLSTGSCGNHTEYHVILIKIHNTRLLNRKHNVQNEVIGGLKIAKSKQTTSQHSMISRLEEKNPLLAYTPIRWILHV